MEVTEAPLQGLKWFASAVLSISTSLRWVEMAQLCTISGWQVSKPARREGPWMPIIWETWEERMGSLVSRKALIKLNKVGYPQACKSCMAHLSFISEASRCSCSSSLHLSLSSSCFLNNSAASRARLSLPNHARSSCVTSLVILHHLGTGVWPSTNPVKFMAGLMLVTGMGSGCNGVRKMSREVRGVHAGVWEFSLMRTRFWGVVDAQDMTITPFLLIMSRHSMHMWPWISFLSHSVRPWNHSVLDHDEVLPVYIGTILNYCLWIPICFQKNHHPAIWRSIEPI